MNYTLKGYKSYLGAAGVMLTAIGKVLSDYYNGVPVDVPAFIAMFSVGFGILGIGAKLHQK